MPDLIALKCPSCGSPLQVDNAPGMYPVGRCPHCKTLCALPQATPQPFPKPLVSLPKSMSISSTPQELLITRRWYTAMVYFLTFFAIIWNGFMVVWQGIALSKGIWFMSLFGLLHSAVGIFLIYYVFALFLNRTEIRVAGGSIKVSHAPLPWFGSKVVATRDIQQLYCQQKINRGENGSSTSYNVEMVCTGNRREILLKGLTSADQALYIEQQLESRLGIVDVPVTGEYAG